jgi:hypothetical protein
MIGIDGSRIAEDQGEVSPGSLKRCPAMISLYKSSSSMYVVDLGMWNVTGLSPQVILYFNNSLTSD